MENGLEEIWNIRASRGTKKIYPLHTLCSVLGKDIALQLPAAHSLTGCDTVSKVGTKRKALKALPSNLIENIGTVDLNQKLVDNAESNLVNVLNSSKDEVKTFDELRFLKYYDYKSSLDLTKLPCTSSTIHYHILCAFYQCHRWIMAQKKDITTDLSPLNNGYSIKNDYIEPVLVNVLIKLLRRIAGSLA